MKTHVAKHDFLQPFKYFSRFSEDSNLSLIFSGVILSIALLATLSMILLFILNY
jgi:hypothetical protein